MCGLGQLCQMVSTVRWKKTRNIEGKKALKRILKRLFYFPAGIIVDGHLVGAPAKHGVEERSRTYFDQLTISSGAGVTGDITITLSLAAVVVEGEGRDILPVNEEGSVTRQGATITVDRHQSCWVELGRGLQFLVLFHQYKHPSYLQMAHLGFYIADGRGLSATTQGLLGMKTWAFQSNLTY